MKRARLQQIDATKIQKFRKINESTKENKEWADIFCENLLMYYVNHEDNWFAKASYSVLPRCLEMTQKDRKIAIDIMVKKICCYSKEEVRYYGNLGYLHSEYLKTPKNYKKTVKAYFNAAIWKRLKKPKM